LSEVTGIHSAEDEKLINTKPIKRNFFIGLHQWFFKTELSKKVSQHKAVLTSVSFINVTVLLASTQNKNFKKWAPFLCIAWVVS
jgi:hypothetical protein